MNMESLEQEYWCNQLDDLTSSKLKPNIEHEDPEYDDQWEPVDHQNPAGYADVKV